LVGKGRGSDVGSPRTPFRRLDGPKEVSASVGGGLTAGRPLRPVSSTELEPARDTGDDTASRSTRRRCTRRRTLRGRAGRGGEKWWLRRLWRAAERTGMPALLGLGLRMERGNARRCRPGDVLLARWTSWRGCRPCEARCQRRNAARGARPVGLPGRGAGVHWVCGVPTSLHGPSRSHRRVRTPNGVADATWMKRLGRVRALDVAATTSAPVSIPTAIVQNCITPKNVNTLENL
jgi:hypothetical protein